MPLNIRWISWLTAARTRRELQRLLHHGLPIAGAQLLGMSHGAVDAMVAGQLGPVELAAGGAGGALIFIFSLSA